MARRIVRWRDNTSAERDGNSLGFSLVGLGITVRAEEVSKSFFALARLISVAPSLSEIEGVLHRIPFMARQPVLAVRIAASRTVDLDAESGEVVS